MGSLLSGESASPSPSAPPPHLVLSLPSSRSLSEINKNLLKLTIINENSKVASHKINTQMSVIFLHANDELPKSEIRETSHLQQRPKRVTYT